MTATCSRRHFSALVFDIQKVKALEDSYKKCPNRAMGGATGTKIRGPSVLSVPLLGLVPLSFRSAEPGPGGGALTILGLRIFVPMAPPVCFLLSLQRTD